MNRFYSAYLTVALWAVCLLMPSLALAGMGLAEFAERAKTCGVSSDAVAQVQSLVTNDRTTEEQAVSLLVPLLAACVEQLPLESLEDKLAEGVTKQVPSQFIVGALEQRLDGYRFARELLLTTLGVSTPETLAVVGEGVVKDVPKVDFDDYVSTYAHKPAEQFQVGLVMVSLQGQAGFAYDLTKQILAQGYESESLSSGWEYFVRVVLAARKQGIADKTIADAAITVLADDGLVSEVMTELGFTGRDLGGASGAE